MKKRLIIGLLPAIIFIYCACDNQVVLDEIPLDSYRDISSEDAISKNDAVLIANAFRSNSNYTKAESADVSNIKSIVSEGKELMYLINYDHNDGFVIVSATKKYTPIIGYSFNGSIGTDSNPAVEYYLDVISQDIVNTINSESEDVSAYELQWQNYERKVLPYINTKSEDLSSLVNSYFNQWNSAGYDYYSLSAAENYLPADIYNSFVDTAEREANPDFDFMEYSFVTVSYTSIDPVTYGPLIGSTWDQNDSFAFSYDSPSGCGTVAIGQIMFYNQFPNGNWDWSNIHASYGTNDTKQLMHYIKSHISPFGGSSSISAYNYAFLTSCGYSASFISHSNSRVANSIRNGHPVYMSGQVNNSLSSGHAWVCEGYKSLGNVYQEYTLWVIDIDPYPSYDYVAVASEIVGSNPPDYYYMNWGWGGSSNGWYVAGNVTPPATNHDYSTMRYDIVDIVPNN